MIRAHDDDAVSFEEFARIAMQASDHLGTLPDAERHEACLQIAKASVTALYGPCKGVAFVLPEVER
jgi:hypothetical protein